MTAVKSATEASFADDVLKSDLPVLVDFWSTSCTACRMMMPSLEAFAGEQPGVAVIKVNVEENPALAATYAVRSLPTLVVFVGGKEVKRMTGAKTKSALSNETRGFLQ
jgi:thioredoxin 1